MNCNSPHHRKHKTRQEELVDSSDVPSVIVPFLFDQFYWGKRIFTLGVGPEPIPYRRLSAEHLAESLTIATTDALMSQRAAALGEKIRTEDGLKKTMETLRGGIR